LSRHKWPGNQSTRIAGICCPLSEAFIEGRLGISSPCRKNSAVIRMRFRTNMAHIRQSRPGSGLGLKAKLHPTLQVVPSSRVQGLGVVHFGRSTCDAICSRGISQLGRYLIALKEKLIRDADGPAPRDRKRLQYLLRSGFEVWG